MRDQRKISLYIMTIDFSILIGISLFIISILVDEFDFILRTMSILSFILGIKVINNIKSIDPAFDVWSFRKNQILGIPTKYDRSTKITFLAIFVIVLMGTFNALTRSSLDFFDKTFIMLLTCFLLYATLQICLVIDDLLSE